MQQILVQKGKRACQNHCLRHLCIGFWSKIGVCDTCASDFCPKLAFATPVHRILVQNYLNTKNTLCDACRADLGQKKEAREREARSDWESLKACVGAVSQSHDIATKNKQKQQQISISIYNKNSNSYHVMWSSAALRAASTTSYDNAAVICTIMFHPWNLSTEIIT